MKTTIRTPIFWALSKAAPNTAIPHSDIAKVVRAAGWLASWFDPNYYPGSTMYLDWTLKKLVEARLILKPIRGKYLLNPELIYAIDSQFPRKKRR